MFHNFSSQTTGTSLLLWASAVLCSRCLAVLVLDPSVTPGGSTGIASSPQVSANVYDRLLGPL